VDDNEGILETLSAILVNKNVLTKMFINQLFSQFTIRLTSFSLRFRL